MSVKGSGSRVDNKKDFDKNFDLIDRSKWRKKDAKKGKGERVKSARGRVTRYTY